MSDWILDLFSGLGGASEAFANHPHWRVKRIENNEKLSCVEHTAILDVTEWMDWLPAIIDEMGRAPTIVWASPECKFFSQGFHAPGPTAKREGRTYTPPMEQIEAIYDIIHFLKDEYAMPKYWVVENVVGSRGYFSPYFGHPTQKIGAMVLYGEFPDLVMPSDWKPKKKQNISNSKDPLRYNKRSVIPIELSEALLDAVHAQSTLADWI